MHIHPKIFADLKSGYLNRNSIGEWLNLLYKSCVGEKNQGNGGKYLTLFQRDRENREEGRKEGRKQV